MKQKIIKLSLISALTLVIGIGLVSLISNFFLMTLFNGIFGSENGVYACNLFMRFCLPIIVGSMICIRNARDEEAHRSYLKEIEGERYEAKQDLFKILHDKLYWAECIIFAVLFIFMIFYAQNPVWMFPVSIPIFVIVNALWRMHLHKSWANARIRLSSSSETK